MFKVLGEEGINMQLISTSEIKISVVIDEKYLELKPCVRCTRRSLIKSLMSSPWETTLIDLVSTIYHIGIFVR